MRRATECSDLVCELLIGCFGHFGGGRESFKSVVELLRQGRVHCPERSLDPHDRCQEVAGEGVSLRERVMRELIEREWDEVSEGDFLADRQPQILDGELFDRLRSEGMAAPHQASCVIRRRPPARWIEGVERARRQGVDVADPGWNSLP